MDKLTANYELLLIKKEKGEFVKLPTSSSHKKIATPILQRKNKHTSGGKHNGPSPLNQRKESPLASTGSNASENTPPEGADAVSDIPETPKGRRRNTVAQNPLSLLKQKRDWGSTGVGLDKVGLDSDDTKLRKGASNSELMSPGKRETMKGHIDDEKPPMNAPLGELMRREEKGFKGSFERFTDRIKMAFGSSRSLDRPRTIKGLFSVNNTSTKPPEVLIKELHSAALACGAEIKEKSPYIIKLKFMKKDKVQLQLTAEVCFIKRMEDMMTGIRLSRIKGETSEYVKKSKQLMEKVRL